MKIKSVRITNFRSLQNVTIPFDSVTTFIGPNGVGKSTVLRALDWFFNGKPGMLSEKDCSFGATNEVIEVQVTFSDLTNNDREALGKYATAGVAEFTAWKRRLPDGSESLSANAKGYRAFNEIKLAANAASKKDAYTQLKNAHPDLNLRSANTVVLIDQAMTEWEASHTDQLEDIPETLQTNFFGFNSSGKMSGLFDYVLVTADLRASEESIDGKSSIIGRILERSIDRSAADEEIKRIVEESRTKQQQVYEEKFKEQLDDITKQLNEVVTSYSPGRAITVAPADVELKAPRTTFEVAIQDGTTETAVERQGHGFQRTILISALQLLAQSGSASTDGVICLAIEEPEIFQHPIQAQVFAKVLRSLAEDPGKRIQVTYATHSPYFIEVSHFDQVRRLTRSSNENQQVTVHWATIVDVKSRLNDLLSADKVASQIDGMVKNQLAEALFAHRVLLVEGTTDSSVFYGISDRISLSSLEAKGICIVPAGGKTNIPILHSILKTIGIPVYTLFDADSGFEARAKKNGHSQDKIDNDRNTHVSGNHLLLKYFGLAEEEFPVGKVEDEVAIFEDNLESYLSHQWIEWVTACNTIETSMGIKLRKNHLVYRHATLKAEGEVPEMLLQILAKAEGK